MLKGLTRKMSYIIILAGYYTFILVFSLQTNYSEIILSTTIITVISYVWLIKSSGGLSEYLFDYVDIVINVFIYSFISFSIAFMTMYFSALPFDTIGIVLILSPVVLWVIIWTDYYFYSMKERKKLQASKTGLNQ